MNNAQLINITALSKLLGIDRSTVYQWLNSEELPRPAKLIHRRRYWTAEQINIFLNNKGDGDVGRN